MQLLTEAVVPSNQRKMEDTILSPLRDRTAFQASPDPVRFIFQQRKVEGSNPSRFITDRTAFEAGSLP